MPGGIGLASSLSERESDLEAPVAPGLRRIGLLTKVVAIKLGRFSLNHHLSPQGVEEALASTTVRASSIKRATKRKAPRGGLIRLGAMKRPKPI